MQLFARLPPAFLRRLRRALQLAIPAAVAADTARSCVVTYHLAQRRFEEWEEEDNAATRVEVGALLRGVVRRCQQKDSDFWPAFEAAAAAAGPSPSAAAASAAAAAGGATDEAGALAADVWQLMGLSASLAGHGSGSSSPNGPGAAGGEDGGEQAQQQAPPGVQLRAEHAAWAEQEAAQLCAFERVHREGPGSGGVAAAAQAHATHVVVTLGEAMSHVASELAALGLPWTTLCTPPPGVIRVTLGDVVSILASTPPARAAASKRDVLGERVMAAADSTAAQARAALPWPQVAVSRRSALRCSVSWQGFTRPEGDAEPLERDLACC